MYPKQQLRRLARVRNGADHSEVQDDLGDFPVYGSGGEFTRATRPLYSGPAVLLGRKGTIDKPLLVKGEFWTVDTMFCAQPRPGTDPTFLYYACTTIPFDMLSTNTALPSMTQGDLNAVRLPEPDFELQQEIGMFLDRETAKIDALIAKQEQLIATLREDRAATITHAVTKGLDPKVEMKDSGTNSLGLIPEGWETTRFKLLLAEPLAYGANAAADDDTPGNPRYVRITDIDQDGNLRPDTFRSLPPEVAAPFLLEEGDLLFARSGATVGKTFMYSLSWGTCCYAGYLIRARLDRTRIEPAYMNYFTATTSYWHHIMSEQIQATIQNVSAERYGELVVCVPPPSVQRAIVTDLDYRCAKIDTLIAKSTEMIDTLREYRSAMITEAVTGKIDVRGVA